MVYPCRGTSTLDQEIAVEWAVHIQCRQTNEYKFRHFSGRRR